MPEYALTEDQLQAATTTGHSLAVSAAAGSGKTSVLAQRCAFLVCDAPKAARCDIDELLVLTFTEAAAAEMRSRIRETLQQRYKQGPDDPRLRFQLLKLEHAHISTIHSFCRWLIRQHFTRLDLDPNASVMDAEEAALLLDESLKRVFEVRQASGDQKAVSLRRLIQHYAGGREETIASHLIGMYHFVRTLHDGAAWLDGALRNVTKDESRIEELERQALLGEIERQIDGVAATIEFVERCLPDWSAYADEMSHYAESLRIWRQRLAGDPSSFEQVLHDIAQYKIKAVYVRKAKNAPDHRILEKERAHNKLKQVRDWHQTRLGKRFTLFSTAEWRKSLEQISPYVRTLVELIDELDNDYAAAKRQRHVLDFSDLEQLAYRLLADRSAEPTEVARTLQDRFNHVLVDEYQDINPIQDAILRLASRESNDHLPNNLFCVGDVKQSIYRFRMANPEIFLHRLSRFGQPTNSDQCLLLSTNFRSAPSIITGVNRIFEQLMTPALAGINYDKDAALHWGRQPEVIPYPIEVHLIERAGEHAAASDHDEQDIELEDWVDVERQAYLIGCRIQEMVSKEEASYRDMAILLRAATIRAEQMAGILQEMGIPTRADANTGFFAATEISDMLALLNVLDNMQQDIPLAAVMRSGVCGIRFDESSLLAIKQSQNDREFHKCVADYPQVARDPELGARVQSLLSSLNRYRAQIRRTPLPDVLNRIHSETGYFSYVAGRSGGPQRVANLQMLHRRAQQFSRFCGPQSLYGFLRFIERLRVRGEDLGQGSIAGAAGDAVRITTMHNSKGLEFPVVFVANLEKPFNLSDAHGTVTFDREEFIGMPVADPARRIRYPSWAGTRVKERITRQSLAEELRILYVALTRAKVRLILVGSRSIEKVLQQRQEWQQHGARQSECNRLRRPTGRMQPPAAAIPELQLLAANSYADWLVPALSSITDDQAQWIEDPDEEPAHDKIFHIHLHRALDTSGLTTHRNEQDQRRRKACAALDSVPAGEPTAPSDRRIDALFDRLDFVYPSLALGSVPSVLNVSDFKRRVNIWTEEDNLSRQPSARFAKYATPKFLDDAGYIPPTQVGTTTHLFLQHLDYTQPDHLGEQLSNMVGRGWMGEAQARRIDLDAIAWFLNTELGHRAIHCADRLEREVPFIARIQADQFDPQAPGPTGQVQPPAAPDRANATACGGDPRDFIILRGMVDLLIPTAGGYEVIDFKTDRIDAAQIAQRLPIYQEQVGHYAKAISRIWRCPVDRGAVVFLVPRVIEFADTTQSEL